MLEGGWGASFARTPATPRLVHPAGCFFLSKVGVGKCLTVLPMRPCFFVRNMVETCQRNGTHPAFLDTTKEKIVKMMLIALLSAVLLLSLGATSAVADSYEQGKGASVPTTLLPYIPPPTAHCRWVEQPSQLSGGGYRQVTVPPMVVPTTCGGLVYLPGADYLVQQPVIRSGGLNFVCD